MSKSVPTLIMDIPLWIPVVFFTVSFPMDPLPLGWDAGIKYKCLSLLANLYNNFLQDERLLKGLSTFKSYSIFNELYSKHDYSLT